MYDGIVMRFCLTLTLSDSFSTERVHYLPVPNPKANPPSDCVNRFLFLALQRVIHEHTRTHANARTQSSLSRANTCTLSCCAEALLTYQCAFWDCRSVCCRSLPALPTKFTASAHSYILLRQKISHGASYINC